MKLQKDEVSSFVDALNFKGKKMFNTYSVESANCIVIARYRTSYKKLIHDLTLIVQELQKLERLRDELDNDIFEV